MLKTLAWVSALLVLGAAIIAVIGTQRYITPATFTETQLVVIPRGFGLMAVSDQLRSYSVITDKWVFITAAVLKGQQNQIKAGEYEFKPGITMPEILSKLTKGQTYKRTLTIREGLTSYQVIEIVNQNEKLGGDLLTDIPAEGTLLPETYHYSAGDTRQALVARMKADMMNALAALWPQRSPDLPFSTQEEAVTLASIVEKETGIEQERRRVAGVFVNRLRQGMKLQTDPTVIYALTQGKPEDSGQGPLGRRLLRKDIESTDSPYNTYLYEGLPPGPIANPGRASLEAVLNPEQHGFLYFVADGKGGHIFATTASEHERNVMQWRKIRAQQNN